MVASVITDEQGAEDCIEARLFTRMGVNLDIDQARAVYCALGTTEVQLNEAAADYERFLADVAAAGGTIGVTPPMLIPIMDYPWRASMIDLDALADTLLPTPQSQLATLIARTRSAWAARAVNPLSALVLSATGAALPPVEIPLPTLIANTVPGAF